VKFEIKGGKCPWWWLFPIICLGDDKIWNCESFKNSGILISFLVKNVFNIKIMNFLTKTKIFCLNQTIKEDKHLLPFLYLKITLKNSLVCLLFWLQINLKERETPFIKAYHWMNEVTINTTEEQSTNWGRSVMFLLTADNSTFCTQILSQKN